MTQEPTPAAATILPTVSRRLRYGRAWNIAARTVHIAATGILLGGHVFDVPPSELYVALGTAIVTGAVLIGLELYTTPHWAHQGCALVVYAKLAVLCAIPFCWAYRVPLLLVVVTLASLGSHAPRSIRHYSIVFRRVMVGPTSSV